MKRLLALALGALAFTGCRDALGPEQQSPIQNTPNNPTSQPTAEAEVRPGYYIVVYKSDVADPVAATHRLLLDRDATVEHTYSQSFKGFAAKLSPAEVDALRSDPAVDQVVPDMIVHAFSTTQTGVTWGIDRIDQHRLPESGTYTYAETGAGVNVYILDTGIRFTHSQFGGRAHFAFDAFGGNGADCNGHGTHVAGTVGGSTYGVAKRVNLYSVRVLGCDGSGPLSGIMAGVEWVTAHHRSPAVANMSLGAGIVPVFDQAVEQSIASGVTYVAAAGNSASDACAVTPAHISQVITVGASTQSDARASYSNIGGCVDIFAPGDRITSADYFTDASTATMSGTSMASPHVAGIAALYLQAHPTASASQVQAAIVGNATTGVLINLAGSANRLAFSGFIGGATSAPPPTSPTSPAPSTGLPSTYAVTCTTNLVCTFDAQAYINAGEKYISWYFGDGYQAGSVKATHSYPKAGTYSAKLIAFDANLRPTTVIKSITVGSSTSAPTSPPPSSTNTFAVSCNTTNHVCSFNASTFVVPNGSHNYSWYLGGGVEAGTPTFVYTYPSGGTRTAKLVVFANDGKEYTVTRSFTS